MNVPVIESPCVGICQIEKATRLCTGCGRTLHEIAGWVQLGEAERRRIMSELPARRGKGAA